MKRDTYEINCHCQGGTLTSVNELSACKLSACNPTGSFFILFLYFRDANLQCFSRKSIDTFPAIWILFTWYTDNSSFPENERKMQKLQTAERSGKSHQKKSRWNFSIKQNICFLLRTILINFERYEKFVTLKSSWKTAIMITVAI